MKSLEQRIAAIEDRNRKVEADKARETSWTRRISFMLLTYIVVALYLTLVVGVDPWLNALVPVVGFFLSTLAVSTIKEFWLNHRDDN